MHEKINTFLEKVLPPAKYSDGKTATCKAYRFFNMIDPLDD